MVYGFNELQLNSSNSLKWKVANKNKWSFETSKSKQYSQYLFPPHYNAPVKCVRILVE